MANYVLLRRIKLSETTSSITFANIPQTGYTDLKIVVSGRISASAEQGVLICQPNSATTNLSSTILYGFGNNQGSSSYSVEQSIWSYINGATSTSNGFSSNEIYIPNFNSTSAYKAVSVDGLNVNNATNARQSLTAGLWSSNTAISSVKLYPADGSFSASSFLSGSTFSLYGIAATGTSPATGPKADGGNIISTDGTYWYHTFLSSGFFTPISSLTCDYLVVAGGGGGGPSNSVGSRGGGGGGAGGYRYFTSQSLTANTTYTATIGAGGANYTQGATSSFNSSSSTGGGYGGTSDVGGANSGGSGGSGGGAGQHPGTRNGGAGNAGGYTPVEGYAGTAITTDAPPYGGAPGGGSSGTASYTNPPTTPTNGTSNSISGSAVTYAVGGRGGLGDAEGAAATAGGANTGNGGQGGPGKSSPYQNSPGGAGGSGIVIIRYAV